MTAAPASPCSRRPTRSAARPRGPAARSGSRTTRTWPRSASRTAARRRSRTSCRCRRDMLEQRLVEAYVDAGPAMVEHLEAKTPVMFYAVAGMPDYHPEFPGGSPGGGRTLECPIYPFDELGEWAARVTPSPYFPDPHITMSETPLGKAVPEPPSAEEHARQRTAQRARVRPGARRAAAASLPRPRHRTAHVVRGRRPHRRGRSGGRGPARLARRTCRGPSDARCDPRLGRVRVERRAAARVPPRPDDAPGVDRDEHRRRAADGDARRGDAVEHARGVVDPGRRGTGQTPTRSAGSSSTASGRCPTRSWSTVAAAGSPTKPPTTTRSAPRSTSRTCLASSTPTCRAG